MRRLLITLRFDGTDYCGWQVQPNGVSVQQRVQDALEQAFGVRLPASGCSRTDSGVHAREFCFHTDTSVAIPCEKVPLALNRFLPDDIAVTDCREVPHDFHARYSCKGKTYVYRICDAKVRDPFNTRFTAYHRGRLDADRMNAAAAAFLGTHDFSAFCASGSSVEDKVRTVSEAKVERVGDEVRFTVTADGFLYNMVRIMAGTLLDVSLGLIDSAGMSDIIASRDREKAGRTAPARGLTLEKVSY